MFNESSVRSGHAHHLRSSKSQHERRQMIGRNDSHQHLLGHSHKTDILVVVAAVVVVVVVVANDWQK